MKISNHGLDCNSHAFRWSTTNHNQMEFFTTRTGLTLKSCMEGIFSGPREYNSPWESFPSVPSDLPPLPAGSVPSVPSLPSLGSSFEVEQPAPIQPLDDTNEPYNQPNGYWYTRRILIDYLKADMDTNFDRTPSYSKYRRVFELVVGPKTRLVEVLADIANNPEKNSTIERARRIMNSIYQQQIKDCDLDSYEFHD